MPPAMTTDSPAAAGTVRLPLTRGRRAALAVGVPACLLLVAASGLSLVADFGEGSYPVHYTAPAAARSLAVHISGGDLAVQGASSGPATVSGTARYSLARSHVTEDTSADGLSLGYSCPISVGTCSLDAAVRVPAGLPVTVTTGGGDAAVTGTDGPVTVSTGGGDLSAHSVSGPLSLTAGGGNIRADGVSSATVAVDTGGGDVELAFTRVPRDVQVNTGGGDITIVLPRGQVSYHVTAGTGGGDVSVGVPQDPSSTYQISTSSGGGDITIREQ
jgi:hypothetical protein